MTSDQIRDLCNIIADWKRRGTTTIDAFHALERRGVSDGGEYRHGQAMLECADDVEQFLKGHEFIADGIAPAVTE